MMGFGFIFILLIWGVVIAGAIWLGKNLLNNNGNLVSILGESGKNSAVEILEKRHAKGEITRDEFEIMKKNIA